MAQEPLRLRYWQADNGQTEPKNWPDLKAKLNSWSILAWVLLHYPFLTSAIFQVSHCRLWRSEKHSFRIWGAGERRFHKFHQHVSLGEFSKCYGTDTREGLWGALRERSQAWDLGRMSATQATRPPEHWLHREHKVFVVLQSRMPPCGHQAQLPLSATLNGRWEGRASRVASTGNPLGPRQWTRYTKHHASWSSQPFCER